VIIFVVYGSETWSVIVIDMKRVGTWDRKMLRRVHGPPVQQGMWRIRTDQELRELYKYLDITAYIQKNRLERIGYVIRMDQDI
jgi:hypothetical protein